MAGKFWKFQPWWIKKKEKNEKQKMKANKINTWGTLCLAFVHLVTNEHKSFNFL